MQITAKVIKIYYIFIELIILPVDTFTIFRHGIWLKIPKYGQKMVYRIKNIRIK